MERREDSLQVGEISVIHCETGERGCRDSLQQRDRIVSRFLPELAVQPLEQRGRIGVPCPVEVRNQVTQGREGFGEGRLNDERPRGTKAH